MGDQGRRKRENGGRNFARKQAVDGSSGRGRSGSAAPTARTEGSRERHAVTQQCQVPFQFAQQKGENSPERARGAAGEIRRDGAREGRVEPKLRSKCEARTEKHTIEESAAGEKSSQPRATVGPQGG